MDPRTDFLSNVDINATRVKSFRGFIFLCGGAHDLNHAPQSLRSLLVREMSSGRYNGLADRIKLAEEIQDWFRGETYSDLVKLEEHLASLSSLIVLVVESGGAIAELGVFSTVSRFSDRMLTLVANAHYEQKSFIRLGPIQRLENQAEDRVLVYDWIGRNANGNEVMQLDDLGDDVREAVQKIIEIISSPSSETRFDWDDSLHVMLLICELCDLFGALQLTEIEQYIADLGGVVKLAEIKQYLFLLDHCGMIAMKKKGHAAYYYAPGWVSHISFSLGGSAIDRNRLRVDVSEHYKSGDDRRVSVIRWIHLNAN